MQSMEGICKLFSKLNVGRKRRNIKESYLLSALVIRSIFASFPLASAWRARDALLGGMSLLAETFA